MWDLTGVASYNDEIPHRPWHSVSASRQQSRKTDGRLDRIPEEIWSSLESSPARNPTIIAASSHRLRAETGTTTGIEHLPCAICPYKIWNGGKWIAERSYCLSLIAAFSWREKGGPAHSSLSRTAVYASGFLSRATPLRPTDRPTPVFHLFPLASPIKRAVAFSPSPPLLSLSLSLYHRAGCNRCLGHSCGHCPSPSLHRPSTPSWKGAHIRTWRRRCQGDCATLWSTS